jgi:phosphate-selective porin OprO and OprP
MPLRTVLESCVLVAAASFRPIVCALLGVSFATAVSSQQSAAQDPAPSPSVQAGAGGFAFQSADRNFTLRVRGLLQVDGRVFDGDSSQPGDSEWLLRRVRPTFDGTFGDRIGFRLMPDFGNGRTEVPDAYVDVALADGGPVLRAGKFKPPVGLERLRSANHLQLIERSIVTELVPRRDVGVQVSGGGDRFNWAAGTFNGVVDGSSLDEDLDGKQDLAVRVFSLPFAADSSGGASGLGIGLAATHGSTDGTTTNPLLPGYRSPGQKVVFTYRTGAQGTFASGERTRISPQLYYYRGPFGVMGEAVRVSQGVRRSGTGFDREATLDHDAWELTANWFLTGQTAGYRDPSETGAIELVARVSALSVDEDSFAGDAESFADPAVAVRRADTRAVGVNWFPYASIKASLSYQQTKFAEGAAVGDRLDERVLLARLQLYF